MSNLAQTPQLNIPAVIGSPILAKIEHINDLGKSTWYEVVYYDDKWYSYAGSKTFQDGERVMVCNEIGIKSVASYDTYYNERLTC